MKSRSASGPAPDSGAVPVVDHLPPDGGPMRALVDQVHQLAGRLEREVTFMEVCGTHTMVAFRIGLREVIPARVRLISGPGCPVCVTDMAYLDAAIELSRRPEVVVTTFGDLMRVPGSRSSLEQERAAGAEIRIVYSPSDALVLARECPSKQVVFLGIGFETTAPTVAWSIFRAAREETRNFSVLCAHKTMPRAMEALVQDGAVSFDGFICPGHVSVITGAAMYRFLAEQYHVPCVISGFEAWDMLQAIRMLLAQQLEGRAAVEIEYGRSVNEHGNRAAQRLMEEVFEPADAAWRGLGMIPGSGLAIRPQYAQHDAAKVHHPEFTSTREPAGCRCGEVLRGLTRPTACGLFGKVCNPLHPIGPCMVSSEGTCAAYFKYSRRAAA